MDLMRIGLIVAMIFSIALTIACDADDGDDDDELCDYEGVCEGMIETGFFYEMTECMQWWEYDGEADCEDFDSFYACACDCVGMGPENFEACMGECGHQYCYTN